MKPTTRPTFSRSALRTMVFTTMSVLIPSILSAQTPSTEHWRPRFHFSNPTGGLGDPNGLFYREGRWHLQYQMDWPRSWGHASSRDLLHWDPLPRSLAAAPRDACWSGGAVDDARNTSGLFASGGGLIAIYTAYNPEMKGKAGEQSIALATSADGGSTWTRYAKNPVLVGAGPNFRDPKVFWHEPTARWVMLLSEAHHLTLFASRDLITWEKLSVFQPPRPPEIDAFECPDLFPLPVAGQPGVTKWILSTSYLNSANFSGPTGFGVCEQQYFVGEFDGRVFTAETGMQPSKRLGSGPDEYAAITWPRQDDPARTLIIGWMGRWGYSGKAPTQPWKEHMTLPREVTLHQTARADWELRQAPARELWAMPHSVLPIALKTIEVAQGRQVLGKSRGAALRVVLKPAKDSVIQFELFSSSAIRTLVGYDSARQVLFFDRLASGSPAFHPNFLGRYETPLPLPANRRLDLTIVLDRIAIEVFARDGAAYLSGNVYPDPSADEIAIQALSGSAEIETLELRTFSP